MMWKPGRRTEPDAETGVPPDADPQATTEAETGTEAETRRDTEAASTERTRPPRRRVVLVAAACLAAAVAGAGVTAFAVGGRGPAEDDAVAPETEVVERGDLTELVKATGKVTLIGDQQVGSQLTGTVTSLPAVGTVVGRNAELYRIDDGPVFAFLGPLPLWRDIGWGSSDGRDIAELQDNLAALGHYSGPADGEFGRATSNAISAWQASVGLERTGELELGRVVMLPGEGQIVGRNAEVGAQNSPGVLTVAQNRREVTLDLPADRRDVTEIGAIVSIRLPDGTEIEGTVREFLAPKEDSSNGSSKLTVPVTIDFEDQAAAEGMQNLGVSAQFERTAAEDTLIVPVAALIAGDGGASVVQRPGADGTVEPVPVTVTQIANGRAAIESDALHEGDAVVIGQ